MHHPLRATRTSGLCRLFAASLALALTTATALHAQNQPDTLVGRAVLDAATFAPGPTSGTRLGTEPINGQPVPFVDKQPVQGVSAILDNGNGSFLAMSDNGFGGLENSPDYHLRVYTLRPDFETTGNGSGDIEVEGYFELRDPDGLVPFAITNHFTSERILTGADFDIESFQRLPDGTFWFGDEFGPFLLHTDAVGKLLEAPVPLPDFDNPGKETRAPQNPFNEEISAVRVMNAVRRHAQIHGNDQAPVMSPWYVMLDDDNPATVTGDRETPPSGLDAASSGIFNVGSLQRAGFPVVVYTVNDRAAMDSLLALGVDGIISDRPDILYEAVADYDGDGDGRPDFLDADGLIDVSLFDAQGHRGARNLRPENTLPAMEAALDNLMPTLETDNGITQDGIPVLSHDPYIESAKARKVDGTPYETEDEVLIKDLTLEEIQSTFIADKILDGRPEQTNSRSLSPVAVAFAAAEGLVDPYVPPSLQQLFGFVNFYVAYYQTGAGSGEPEAEQRWKNAARVRFNVETKINPRTDADEKGNVFAERTVGPEPFAEAVAGTIVANDLERRADVQSFDFRTLLIVQEEYPALRTVYLFGDFPKVGDVGDGTNLQDQDGMNTPWLAGLYWPYRVTALEQPFRAQGSGGFEGMALSTDGAALYPLLEKPLDGAPAGELLIHAFSPDASAYTGERFIYSLEPEAAAIGDFILYAPGKGLVIERDNSQGDLDGFKAIYQVDVRGDDETVEKTLLVDLLDLEDPAEISLPGLDGDVGIGEDFAFPFVTIESVVVLGEDRIGVLNDNNYPFSVGRHVGAGLPDDTEFIVLKLGETLELASAEDTTPPECEIVQVDPGPPTTLRVRVRDGGSGLASITVRQDRNATVNVPAFTPGIQSVLFVTAEKLNESERANVVLEVEDVAGNVTVCDPVLTTLSAEVPEQFALEQNYPNPFNPTTRIEFALPEQTHVRLRIYDVMGREVTTLVDEPVEAGAYQAEWDGRNAAGQPVASGPYLYRIEAGAFIEAKTMTLLK